MGTVAVGHEPPQPIEDSMNVSLVRVATAAAVLIVATGCPGKDDPKAPRAPGNLTATAGDAQAELDWDPAPRADRYIVYIAQEPGITKENYQSLQGGGRYDYDDLQPPFVATGLANGTTYFFVVTSVSADNYEGPESGEVLATPSPWGIPSVVESAPGEAIGLTAGVDGAGNILAVWGRGVGGGEQRIHSARFDATLGAFGSIAVVDTANGAGGISGTPSLAVHPGGDALVAWRQGSGTNDMIWGAAFDGVNGWDPPYLLTDSGSMPARNPAVAFAGDDMFAVWTQTYLDTSAALTTGIFGRVAADGGGFGADEQLDPPNTNTDNARIVAAANYGMAAWVQNDLVYTNEWSGAWSGAAAIVTTSDEPIAVQLASNESAEMVLLWTEQNLSADLYASFWNPLDGWSAPEVIEQTALDVVDARVAICDDGRAVTVFTQMAGLHTRLMASRRDIDGWSEPHVVYESLDGDAESPSLVVQDDCTARAVWLQEVVDVGGPGTTRNVYSTTNFFDATPDDWGPALLVSQYGLSSTPVIVVDGDGNVSALWEYYGASGEEIWFNRLGD